MHHHITGLLLGLAILGMAVLGLTAPDPFDPEHWLAEQEMICANLERGGECAP